MRQFHRWVAVIPSLLLIFIAATGILLQIDLIASGKPPPGGSKPRGEARPEVRLSKTQIHDRLERALVAAEHAAPGAPINQINLTLGPARQSANVSIGSATPKRLALDLKSGRSTISGEGEGLHYVLQNLHAGYVYGLPGQIVSILCGLTLLGLSATGLWVYVDMFRRRLKLGRRNPFW